MFKLDLTTVSYPSTRFEKDSIKMLHMMRLGNMARTSRGKFEDINEKSFVGVAWVIRQHSLIHILLSTLALKIKVENEEEFKGNLYLFYLVTRCEKSTS